MVISRLRAELRKRLGENAHEADWIISHVTGLSQTDMVLTPREATEDEYAAVCDIVKRRAAGEPLQYILGETEFMGMVFRVNGSTLIPRADTETLVETAASYIGDRALKVLDIGTGSGCVGISLAKLCMNAEVTLLDISEDALEIAAYNADKNGVAVDLVRCDIMRGLPGGEFDVIVSNPPYIRSADIAALDGTVKDHEPLTALDGGADGLDFYRRITAAAPELRCGYLAYEIGFDQGGAVAFILRAGGFSEVKVIKDLCGNDRVVCGIR